MRDKFWFFTGRLCVLFILLSLVHLSPAEAGDESKEVLLRFALASDQLLHYKGTMTHEINWQGTPVFTTHTDIVELAAGDTLEDGRLALSLKYLDSVDKRRIADGASETIEGQIKSKGRTVKIIADELGDVKEVHGAIMGLEQGAPMRDFVIRWFFRLPEQGVTKGSKWVREVPDPENEAEKESGLTGTVECELDKFEDYHGIEVAVIKFKGKFAVNRSQETTTIIGEMKNEGKVRIALNGGYIVELESSSEMKGDVTSIDEYTGKETTDELVRLAALDVKLETGD